MKRLLLIIIVVLQVGSSWVPSGNPESVASLEWANRSIVETNKAVVRGYMEAILNRGGWDEWDRYFARELVFNGSRLTREQMKDMVDNKRAHVPDFGLVIEDQIAEGDKVVTRVAFRGTHPTGDPVAYMGIGIDRIVNGKVVEMWHVADSEGAPKSSGRR